MQSNEAAGILNSIYKEAISRESPSARSRRRYRLSVAKYRYGDGTPLDLYFSPRNEFISVFSVEAYIHETIGYRVVRDGPIVIEFEDRGDDIFTKGRPVFVEVIPFMPKGGDEMDWYIQIHSGHTADNDNSIGEVSRAA